MSSKLRQNFIQIVEHKKDHMKAQKVAELKTYLSNLGHIKGIQNLLQWDMETGMPEGAITSRSEQMKIISSLQHQKATSNELQTILDSLETENLNEEEAILVREVKRDFKMAKALPASFVEELTHAAAHSQRAWAKARTENNYKLFEPHLSKMIELSKRKADYFNTGKTQYDSLVDEFEPGMSVEVLNKVLNPLRDESIKIFKQIQEQGKFSKILTSGDFSKGDQRKLSEAVMKFLKMPMENFRLDESAHPFSTSFHPTDCRITTRYNLADCTDSFTGTVHECGHSMYELNLPHDWFGTPFAEAASYGIHESQSRMWEIFVAKRKPFWEAFYPKLQEIFPVSYKNKSLDEFYHKLNVVMPSLIRVEADEVTYNLHVMVRFEMEKAIFNENAKIADLPEMWNEKYRKYLGVSAQTYKEGLMQDVHWSQGAFGYFPSYTLGTLFAAQFYDKAKKDVKDLEKNISAGDVTPLKDWLTKNIHSQGRKYQSLDLVKRVTGNEFSSQYFIDHLRAKYLT